MGANNSSLTPLNCILKNWDRFDPQGLKKTHLVFLCDTAWPRYPLEDGKWWLVGESLKYNTVLQLDRFCKEQGKWVEVAYVLPFFSLRNMPDLCPKGIDWRNLFFLFSLSSVLHLISYFDGLSFY